MADPIHSEDRKRTRMAWWLTAFGGLLALLALRFVPRRRRATETKEPAFASGEVRQEEKPMTAFEPTDWQLGPVALIYLAIPVLLVISSFALIAAYPNALPDVRRTLRIAPPGPLLQTDSEGDLRRFRAAEEKRLNGYSWVDKQKGVVRIPIEQAMKRLVKSGAAGFPKEQE